MKFLLIFFMGGILLGSCSKKTASCAAYTTTSRSAEDVAIPKNKKKGPYSLFDKKTRRRR